MSVHVTAIAAAAKAIRRPRYLMYPCTDQELAELVVRTYYQNLPVRTRPPRRCRRPDPTAEPVSLNIRAA